MKGYIRCRKVIRCILLIIILWCLSGRVVYAGEVSVTSLYEDMDLKEINHIVTDILGDDAPQFSALLKDILTGNEKLSFDLIIKTIKNLLFSEVQINKNALISIIIISIAAAIFSNIAAALDNHQIAEVSFFLMYLLLITILVQGFRSTLGIAQESIQNLTRFMEVLTPAYLIAVSFIAGSGAAASIYASSLFIICGVEWLLLSLVIPMIQVYVVMTIVNQLSKEEMLKHFVSLVRLGIQYLLKTAMAVVVGIQVIQGLITPVVGMYKKTMLNKAVAAIPGMGNVADSVAEMFIGSAVIIKNGIGVTALVIVVLISMIPVLKLVFLIFMYKFAAALVGPVSSRGMASCISDMGECAKLLLRTLVTAIILFMISIAIVAASTNGGM